MKPALQQTVNEWRRWEGNKIAF